ncbi:MAG: YdcF family protein [Candidatus Shapirobacteria bacterium]|jgi:hypothetical protein
MGYVSKRNDASQAFDYEELQEILKMEAKRPIREEKRMVKLVDYSLARKWLKEIGVDSKAFSRMVGIISIIDECNKIKEKIGKLTLEKVNKKEEGLLKLLEKIKLYLGQEDTLENGDIILVFGGKNPGRIKKAVELWKQGWAPRILISGNHPIYFEHEPEALAYKKWAIENGVPEKSILTESQSITIVDNIKRSLSLLENRKVIFNKIITVIGWYAQKRAWMSLDKYLPRNKQIIRVNAFLDDDNQLSPTKWHLSEFGINIIFNEFVKMKIHDWLVMNSRV